MAKAIKEAPVLVGIATGQGRALCLQVQGCPRTRLSPPPPLGVGLSLEHHVFASNSDSSQNANIPEIRLWHLSKNEHSIEFNRDWLEGKGGGGGMQALLLTWVGESARPGQVEGGSPDSLHLAAVHRKTPYLSPDLPSSLTGTIQEFQNKLFFSSMNASSLHA